MHAINSVKPTATMRAQIRYPLSEVRDRFDRMNEFCHTITTKSQLRELLFRISVALKGLHATLEIVGGIALLVVSPAFILRAMELLTQDEVTEDPRDLIANNLHDAARHLSLGSQHFAAYYLLSHGVTKAFLVAALLKGKRWAYPLAVIVFGAFIAYQLYRFTFTHSIGLIALSLFDFAVIWLIWLEYRSLGSRAY
jgi:uncharacterized membrane protein